MEQTQPTQKTSYEFLYFYLAGTVLMAAVSIGMTIYGQMYQVTNLQEHPVYFVINGITSLFGFVLFVLSIVSLFLFKKWHYPKATLVAPITYLAVSVMSGITGAIYGAMLVSKVMSSVTEETDPMVIQQQFENITLPLWLTVAYVIFCVIRMGGAFISWRAVQK